MASPVGDSYSCAPGGVIAAGRHRIAPGNYRVSIWGQSNAVGRALRSDISASPLSSDSGLVAHDAGTFDRVYIWDGSNYSKLNAANNQCLSGQFGAEFALAVRWMRETTTGNLYIDKEAEGGVSIDYFDPTGVFYGQTKTRRTNANAWLSSNSITVNDIGWLWVQGEQDAAQSQSWYQTRLEAMIAARTTDGFQGSGTKRILSKMHPSSATYGAGVDAAKVAAASASSSNTTAPVLPYYMRDDNIHLNGQGVVQLGYDAFEQFFGSRHIAT